MTHHTNGKPFTVGTTKNEYGTARNIAQHVFPQFDVVRTYDLFSVANYALGKLTGRKSELLANCHVDIAWPRVSLYHFWNTISASRTPWVVTFETAVPRWAEASRRGVQWLAGPACKKLIALSQAAYEIQKQNVAQFPDLKEEVLKKLCVVHPPQPLVVNTWEEKGVSLDGPLTFALVGADFMRKGGKEVLLAFDRLFADGLDVRLVAVGELMQRYRGITDQDIRVVEQLVEKHRGRVTYHPRLSKDQVIEVFKNAHVALLPTFADSYGYVVLEAQACGTPVISTDVRALPEINPPDAGWLIELPGRLFRRWSLTPEDHAAFSRIIETEVVRCVTEIVRRPEVIREKGAQCLHRIARHHDPRRHRERLEAIYQEALAGSAT